jgi:hypothetical protein
MLPGLVYRSRTCFVLIPNQVAYRLPHTSWSLHKESNLSALGFNQLLYLLSYTEIGAYTWNRTRLANGKRVTASNGSQTYMHGSQPQTRTAISWFRAKRLAIRRTGNELR